MRPKRRILLAVVSLAFILGLVFWFTREPHYQGKPYRAWLDQYISSVGGSKAHDEAKQAMLHIGPDAIPTLLSMIGARDSGIKKFIIARVHGRWTERIGLSGFLWRYRQRSNADPLRASVGFPLLGPAASNAVPGLARIVRTSDNPQGIECAIQCLHFIGPPARVAIPDLVYELKSTNHIWKSWGGNSIRVEAICSLACEDGKWQPDCLKMLLPALANALKETNAATAGVLMMLEKIGPDAKSAIPAIQPFLTSTNSDIALRAAQALKSIDPDSKFGTGKFASPFPVFQSACPP